ncbi:MAG: hypothetical protein J7L11_03990 [Thermoprotei archaeon]|nr:hypothetical protein [Thermoprotei archaeon]
MFKVLKQCNAFIVKETDLKHGTAALDAYAYSISNILVGNPELSPALEVTKGFVELEFLEDAIISVTGKAYVLLDRKPLKNLWECIPVRKGSKISISTEEEGSVAYMAIAGEIPLPPKTPHPGRYSLAPGDVIEPRLTTMPFEELLLEVPARHLPPSYIPTVDNFDLKLVLLSEADNALKDYALADKDPVMGVVLEPKGTVPVSDLEEMDPPLGGVICEKHRLVALSHPSNEEQPLLGFLPRNSIDMLSRIPLGAKISFKRISPLLAVREEEAYARLIHKVKRIIEMAVNALRRGATLVRLHFGHKFYEAWVEELS